MYKTETHIHTSPISSCSRIAPREMVRLYKEAGYDTLLISDHFAAHHFKKLGEELSFAQKVELFCRAFDEARDEGKKLGIEVLFSAELSLHGNHYLLYGITKEFMLLREDIFDISLDEFYAHAKAHGLTIIQAHPLRDGKCTPHPHHVDGFEGINTCARHNNRNDEVLALAKQYGLPITCGSDAHRREDIGRCAMLSEEKITSVEQYVELLMQGKLTPFVSEDTV